MKPDLKTVLSRVQGSQSALSSKHILTGFDGFIDSIQKVVFNHPETGSTEYFTTVKQFGDYISEKKTGGLSLETEELVKKIGGNVPIMSNAVAQFGVTAHCIGAFGHPAIDPVFADMHKNTVLHSFANPGITSALEFDDGKIMLAQMSGLNNATWETVKQIIGLDQIADLVQRSDMLCLLNWSEVRHADEIWEGLSEEVFPLLNTIGRKKLAFFDLSDCSKYSSSRISKALEIIRKFSTWFDITLSLNKNEASLVYQSIYNSPCADPETAGPKIFEFLKTDTLVIHTSARSFAWRNSGMFHADAFLLKNPRISTGAGDNFNAGYCTAQLLNMETVQSLSFANLLAACYMKNGRSPGIAELEDFILEL